MPNFHNITYKSSLHFWQVNSKTTLQLSPERQEKNQNKIGQNLTTRLATFSEADIL